jgi:hypothetical protein
MPIGFPKRPRHLRHERAIVAIQVRALASTLSTPQRPFGRGPPPWLLLEATRRSRNARVADLRPEDSYVYRACCTYGNNRLFGLLKGRQPARRAVKLIHRSRRQACRYQTCLILILLTRKGNSPALTFAPSIFVARFARGHYVLQRSAPRKSLLLMQSRGRAYRNARPTALPTVTRPDRTQLLRTPTASC